MEEMTRAFDPSRYVTDGTVPRAYGPVEPTWRHRYDFWRAVLRNQRAGKASLVQMVGEDWRLFNTRSRKS